jgi:BirA family biotin operon repressor/biotin-[acetyl-CoA-carboxylase] ligase
VNLALAPQLPDRETIALSDIMPTPQRDAFAQDLARLFDIELERWRNFGMAPIIKRWLAAGHPQGTVLNVNEPGDAQVSGTFAGLGEDGSLQLRLADGTSRAIHAGEVSLSSPDR